MKKQKVSVCIPIYNGGEYLRQTLESVLRQDYKNLEVIISDNCSTDNTREIVQSFIDGRIRYHRNPRTVGCTKNWNRCIALAKGEYIAIFHADDVYSKEMVSKEAAFLDKNKDCAAVFSAAIVIDDKGAKLWEWKRPPELSEKTDKKELINFFINEAYEPFMCPSFMARKSAMKKTGLFDCKTNLSAFDVDYYVRLANNGKIGFLAEKLMNYRQHGGQLSMPGSAIHKKGRLLNTSIEFFNITEREAAKEHIELNPNTNKLFFAQKRWSTIKDALYNAFVGNKKEALILTKSGLDMSDAFVRFPSPKFFSKTTIAGLFLLAQYAGFGKKAAEAILWFLKERRTGYKSFNPIAATK